MTHRNGECRCHCELCSRERNLECLAAVHDDLTLLLVAENAPEQVRAGMHRIRSAIAEHLRTVGVKDKPC